MSEEPGAELRSPFDYEAPVWWDPKAREVIMKPRSFEPSLLVVHGPLMLLVTDGAVAFSGELSRMTVSFPAQFDIPACDVRHDGDVFRFYFCMPHPKVYEFDAAVVRAIAKVLDGEDLEKPEVARIPIARMMSHTTLHVGKKRMEQLQGMLG